VKVRGDVRTAMRRWWTYERRVTRPDVRDDESPNEVWDAVMADGSVSPRKANPYRDCDTWIDICSADLSPRERLSVLAVLEGWSSSEVALAYGVSPETVKTWRKRALRKLRNALREDE
jgi:RNA polymerase sigma factor (sigma-70 family)